MMLALLVMGVSNVWAATKDYFVNYEREFLKDAGAGYTINAPEWATITKFGELTTLGQGVGEVGDRMIRVESDYISDFESNITEYITANYVKGYATTVVLIENTIYICYVCTDVLSYSSYYDSYYVDDTKITQIYLF